MIFSAAFRVSSYEKEINNIDNLFRCHHIAILKHKHEIPIDDEFIQARD